jgi:uncharacterized protein with HEPN domain
MGDTQRLHHILDAIAEIENYTKDVDLEQFITHSMMRFACIKQIEINRYFHFLPLQAVIKYFECR